MKEVFEKDIIAELKIKNVKIGKNVKIKDGCQLNNVIIGDNTKIGRNVTIYGSEEKPVIIGDNCYIPYGCYFSGAGGSYQIIIKDNVIFSPYCVVLNGSGPFSSDLKSKLISYFPEKRGNVIIGNDCWIMARCTILPDVQLGECVAVAAHSLVKNSFDSYNLIGGIPAKIIKKLNINKDIED